MWSKVPPSEPQGAQIKKMMKEKTVFETRFQTRSQMHPQITSCDEVVVVAFDSKVDMRDAPSTTFDGTFSFALKSQCNKNCLVQGTAACATKHSFEKGGQRIRKYGHNGNQMG